MSTLEAEAVAAREAMCEVIALKWDLEVLDPQLGDAKWTTQEDNQSLIATINVPDGGKYEARKHIAVRICWLREVVATGIVEVVYCESEEQAADIMTKQLSKIPFRRHRKKLMNLPDTEDEDIRE